jgi:hypothetical protein
MTMTPLLEQGLVLLRKEALVAEVVLVLLRVLALVRGQELLAGLPLDAQPLASLRAELRGRAIDCRALAGSGHHGVTAAAPARLPADPRARLQGLRLRGVVAVGNQHPGANAQRYDDGRYSPPSFGTRAPSGAPHSWHEAS